jgi:Tfp pilus assembly protein PilX
MKTVNAPRSDQGSVLVLSLLVTLLLLGVGLGSMWSASNATRISGNLTRRQEALNAAETVVHRAMALLRNAGDWQALLDGTLCSATRDEPATHGMVLCAAATPLENTPVVDSSSATHALLPGTMANVQYTIWVRNDPAEHSWCNGVLDPGETADSGDCNGDGSNNSQDDIIRNTDSDQRVLVRAEGTGLDAYSVATLEAIVSNGGTTTQIGDYSQSGMNGQGTNSATGAAIAMP